MKIEVYFVFMLNKLLSYIFYTYVNYNPIHWRVGVLIGMAQRNGNFASRTKLKTKNGSKHFQHYQVFGLPDFWPLRHHGNECTSPTEGLVHIMYTRVRTRLKHRNIHLFCGNSVKS